MRASQQTPHDFPLDRRPQRSGVCGRLKKAKEPDKRIEQVVETVLVAVVWISTSNGWRPVSTARAASAAGSSAISKPRNGSPSLASVTWALTGTSRRDNEIVSRAVIAHHIADRGLLGTLCDNGECRYSQAKSGSVSRAERNRRIPGSTLVM